MPMSVFQSNLRISEEYIGSSGSGDERDDRTPKRTMSKTNRHRHTTPAIVFSLPLRPMKEKLVAGMQRAIKRSSIPWVVLFVPFSRNGFCMTNLGLEFYWCEARYFGYFESSRGCGGFCVNNQTLLVLYSHLVRVDIPDVLFILDMVHIMMTVVPKPLNVTQVYPSGSTRKEGGVAFVCESIHHTYIVTILKWLPESHH